MRIIQLRPAKCHHHIMRDIMVIIGIYLLYRTYEPFFFYIPYRVEGGTQNAKTVRYANSFEHNADDIV